MAVLGFAIAGMSDNNAIAAFISFGCIAPVAFHRAVRKAIASSQHRAIGGYDDVNRLLPSAM
jgi:hypothetical protein